MYKEYAEILAGSICTLINSSYRPQIIPTSWKLANIILVPKENVVNDINNHLRPMSLTYCLSKLAEEFIIENFVGLAILNCIDPYQLGGIPKSSSTNALISMLHK